jgi:hypothetical protein
MDQSYKNLTGLIVLVSQVPADKIDQSRVSGMIAHGQQTGWLFDRQTMIIFVQHSQRQHRERS